MVKTQGASTWNVLGGDDNRRQYRGWLEYSFRIKRFRKDRTGREPESPTRQVDRRLIDRCTCVMTVCVVMLRFSPSNHQQWSSSASSNRSYTQTPPHSYGQVEQGRPMSNGANDSWQIKQDRPGPSFHFPHPGMRVPPLAITSAGDLSEYYKAYGEVANAFVSTEAMGRVPNHGATYIPYPNVASQPPVQLDVSDMTITVTGLPAHQGYAEFPTSMPATTPATTFHPSSVPPRPGLGHGTHNQSKGDGRAYDPDVTCLCLGRSTKHPT